MALFLIEDMLKSNQRCTRVKTQINVPTFYLRFGLKTRIYEENPIEKIFHRCVLVVGNYSTYQSSPSAGAGNFLNPSWSNQTTMVTLCQNDNFEPALFSSPWTNSLFVNQAFLSTPDLPEVHTQMLTLFTGSSIHYLRVLRMKCFETYLPLIARERVTCLPHANRLAGDGWAGVWRSLLITLLSQMCFLLVTLWRSRRRF